MIKRAIAAKILQVKPEWQDDEVRTAMIRWRKRGDWSVRIATWSLHRRGVAWSPVTDYCLLVGYKRIAALVLEIVVVLRVPSKELYGVTTVTWYERGQSKYGQYVQHDLAGLQVSLA